jgi:hypothetical protein
MSGPGSSKTLDQEKEKVNYSRYIYIYIYIYIYPLHKFFIKVESVSLISFN